MLSPPAGARGDRCHVAHRTTAILRAGAATPRHKALRHSLPHRDNAGGGPYPSPP